MHDDTEEVWSHTNKNAIEQYQQYSCAQKYIALWFKLPDDFESSEEEFKQKFMHISDIKSKELDPRIVDVDAGNFAVARNNFRLQYACMLIREDSHMAFEKDPKAARQQKEPSPELRQKIDKATNGPIKMHGVLLYADKFDNICPIDSAADKAMRGIFKSEIRALMSGHQYEKTQAESAVYASNTSHYDKNNNLFSCLSNYFSACLKSMWKLFCGEQKSKVQKTDVQPMADSEHKINSLRVK